MSVAPLITVLVATYKREDLLCDTLKSILDQDYDSFEIIVVDQTPQHDAPTEKFLHKLKEEKKIKLLFQQTPNLPMARNKGIKAATGSIILFVDDDVKLKKGFLKAHSENYSNHTVTGISGKVELSNPAHDNTEKLCKDAIKDWWYFKFNANKKMEVASAIGCNMSFRKTAIEEAGYFDENFTENAWGEETDLCFRIRKNGGVIMFDPAAELIHYAAQSGGTRSQTNDVTLTKALYRNVSYFILKNFLHGERRRHFMLCYRSYVGREKENIFKKWSVFKRFLKRNIAFLKGKSEARKMYKNYISERAMASRT